MIKKCLKKLNRNEDGVAMTEFVITLPLFILCFIAIAELSPMLRYGTHAAKLASQEVWRKALAVEQEKEGRTYQAQDSALETSLKVEGTKKLWSAEGGTLQDARKFDGEEKVKAGAASDLLTAGVIAAQGDLGEFYARVQQGTLFGLVQPAGEPDPSPGVAYMELYNNSKVGNKIFNQLNWINLIKNALKQFTDDNLLDFTGSRFGVLTGGVSKKFTNRMGEYTVGRYATVLAPPTGVQKFENLGPVVYFLITGVPRASFMPPFLKNYVSTDYADIAGLQTERYVEHYDNGPVQKFRWAE